MKTHWPVLLFVLVFVSVAARGESAPAAAPEPSGGETLYYAVDRQFPVTRWEARTAFAYDFSNPYLQVMGGQAAMFWNANKYVAFGVEGTIFTTSPKDSATALQAELNRHGYRLRTSAPDYGFTGIVRVTPVSGLVNFFSSNVMQAEVSLAFRGGATRYVAMGWGPSLGTGLEVNLRAASGWGILAALVLDWDRVGTEGWMARTGFRVGPTFRF